MCEFICVLENPSLVGVVKIGKTTREVAEGVKELSSQTGVPAEFTVFKEYAVDEATFVESKIHERLKEYRVSENREFFRISAGDAAQIIEGMLQTESWTFPGPEREDAPPGRAPDLCGHAHGRCAERDVLLDSQTSGID